MRIIIALAAIILLATFVPSNYAAGPRPEPVGGLAAEAVSLDASAPDRRRLGALDYIGGWKLTSDDRRFGGLSGLHVAGGTAIAVSDSGWLFQFPLPGSGNAGGIEVRPLLDGEPAAKRERDAESLVVRGRLAWVGLERSDSIWRFEREGWQRTAAARPEAMQRWPNSAGAEAMLRLPDGRFLVFAEGRAGAAGSSAVLLFAGDPAVTGAEAIRLRYRPPSGYRITDASWLPDGRILFLNRRFSWLEGVSAKLTLGRLPRLEEGAELSGEEIADFRAPVTVDNFEALSVTRERGRTIIWIASDDNYTPLVQRTLLLKFALTG